MEGVYFMNKKIEDMVDISKLRELLNVGEKEEEKKKNKFIWVFAIIGAVAAVASLVYLAYSYFCPDDFEDFDDDFDDEEFDDDEDFFDDEV
jgi:hypothetical protein